MELFEEEEKRVREKNAPLAWRMAPRTLGEFVGQEHLLGAGKLLRRQIESDRLSTAIFYGPPGTGKTALARVIAKTSKASFQRLNAVTSGVADLRELIDGARQRMAASGRKTTVFVDEIHRFNRAQQDALLPDVEEGTITFIGATTQNPFFAVTAPLVSRSQIFQFQPLSAEHILAMIDRALADEERGLGKMKIRLDAEARTHWANYSDGDGRRALNALEVAAMTTPPDDDGIIHISLKVAEESIQRKAIVYDGAGDDHYDTISAFIKSMRGSDPDAAIYWLAKMLEAGEDPRFIARRIVICASEDVGNADPQALVVANAALQVSEFIGMPEAQIPLAQATIYVACAPKSNASYTAISEARKDVRENPTFPVPKHLRDANYPGAKRFGHGEGYKYAHDFPRHYVEQVYGPAGKQFYRPTDLGFEAEILKRLEKLRKNEGEKGKRGKRERD
ncbi:MAG: replication-associated recombination protein A [Candidatus Abyssobacteria bacterium SURF_17]|uniref:Replication-associated recombination protein A n=1 Tax=Candidatus Abyssobacteria bacterium SURF_17 TaxID=2093361 RepID=A0A419EV61_9BACT|nr:MAG: replication-associated recombination protein A [Candidatus Abyssubacteria bacterium SURF_17]